MARRLFPLYFVGLLAAGGLKLFYSRAGADMLAWVLAPTAGLAQLLTGLEFEREAGAGWINHSHRMILGPGCAGVNFMIISLMTFFFSFLHRFRASPGRWAWLAASAGIAYALTIFTNALRIVAAIHLYGMDIYGGLLTREGVHRGAGAVIYCSSLLFGYLALECLLSGGRPPRARVGLVAVLQPFGWYLAITLGVPLVRQSFGSDVAGFSDHAIPVVLVCLGVALAGVPLRRVIQEAGMKRQRAGDRIRPVPHPAARLECCEVEDSHRR